MSDIVEKALDEFWRSFSPTGANAYERERERLLGVRRRAEAEGTQRDLLRIDAALVTLADDFERIDDVIMSAREVVAQRDYSSFETTVAVLFLARALHTVEQHDEEIRLAASISAEPTIPAEDAVRILERVVQEHPSRLSWSPQLVEKLEAAVFTEPLAELPEEKKRIPDDSTELADFVLMLAQQLRSWNEEQMRNVTNSE